MSSLAGVNPVRVRYCETWRSWDRSVPSWYSSATRRRLPPDRAPDAFSTTSHTCTPASRRSSESAILQAGTGVRSRPCGVLSPAPTCAGEAGTRARVPAVRVGAEAGSRLEPSERSHLGVAQLEIEHRDVLPDPRRRGRLRDDDVAQLHVPAEHDLGRAAAVPPGQLDDDRVAERPALPERAPGLGDDVVAGVEAAQRRLLEVEVELDLVHGRDDVRLVEQPLQVRHLEVGDPDGADPPVRVELLERAPGVHVAIFRGPGPVDQVEVDVVQV